MVSARPMPARMQRALRHAAYDLVGIKLGPDKETLLTSRVLKRMRELGLDDYDAYLRRFQGDPAEAEHFINAITTNTTYFFREEDHFPILARHCRQRVDRGQRRLRLWCAASSTGQEPYTLAMAVLEGLEGRAVDLQILATDIDTKVLNTAHRGIYPKEQLEKVPAMYRGYFQRSGESVQVVPQVRRLVRFARLNLTKIPYPMKGPLDVILCRNVMIYFDEPTRGKLVGEFERLLGPGALLCIGHSESINGLTRKVRVERPSVYRMPGEG